MKASLSAIIMTGNIHPRSLIAFIFMAHYVKAKSIRAQSHPEIKFYADKKIL